MGALHDAGPALLAAIGTPEPTGAKINKFEVDTKDATGGTKVTVKEIDLTVRGEQYRIVRQGDCYETTGEGKTQRACAADAATQISQSGMPPAAVTAITHVVESVFKDGVGVIATEVDGKWYVSPGRSFFELACRCSAACSRETSRHCSRASSENGPRVCAGPFAY
ncbi:hypothetical protein [Kibdelosporangium philippinense]|uniref:hypothetical protein n=1 Tax=Kibdelosporangium philippinense TaxID=211113 RepID=UPI0036075BEA